MMGNKTSRMGTTSFNFRNTWEHQQPSQELIAKSDAAKQRLCGVLYLSFLTHLSLSYFWLMQAYFLDYHICTSCTSVRTFFFSLTRVQITDNTLILRALLSSLLAASWNIINISVKHEQYFYIPTSIVLTCMQNSTSVFTWGETIDTSHSSSSSKISIASTALSWEGYRNQLRLIQY